MHVFYVWISGIYGNNKNKIFGGEQNEKTKYEIVIQSWNNNWDNLSTYLIFHPKSEE